MAERRTTVTNQQWEAVVWPVSWSAIWVGGLAALAAGLIFGLAGTALGAYSETRIVSWHTFQMWALALSICGAFFAYAIGGWTAGKILGARRAEYAVLHGAIAWLVTIPILLVLAALGAASLYGVWYGGLAGPSPGRPRRRADHGNFDSRGHARHEPSGSHGALTTDRPGRCRRDRISRGPFSISAK